MSVQDRIRRRGSNGHGLRPLHSALAYYQLNRELDDPATAAMPLFEPVRFNVEVSQ